MKPNPKLDTVHGQSIGRSVRVRATVTGIVNRLSGGLSGVEHLAGDKFHNDHGKRCLTF